MGVGLSLCRTIIEAHGGKLGLEDNSAGGATFRFTVPSASLGGGSERATALAER